MKKYNILMLGNFPNFRNTIKKYYFIFSNDFETYTEKEKIDAIVTRTGFNFSNKILETYKNLKLIVKAGSGLDFIDKEFCKKKHIIVVNLPGINSQSVAELTIGLIINLLRHVRILDKKMKEKIWAKNEYIGYELFNKKVTIVGYGYIGRRTAKILKAFNTKIQIFDPTLKEEEKDFINIEGYKLFKNFESAIKNADIVIFHPSLNKTSRNILNSRNMKYLKKGSFIINVSRGDVIEEKALINLLKRNIIKGLAIDCWWEEPVKNNSFLNFENVLMTPHIGANTYDSLERINKKIIEVLNKKLK